MAPKDFNVGDGHIDWVASHGIFKEYVLEREAAPRAQQEPGLESDTSVSRVQDCCRSYTDLAGERRRR
jgi:hypothetical protein